MYNFKKNSITSSYKDVSCGSKWLKYSSWKEFIYPFFWDLFFTSQILSTLCNGIYSLQWVSLNYY